MTYAKACLFPCRPLVFQPFIKAPHSSIANNFSVNQRISGIRSQNIWASASASLKSRYRRHGVEGLTQVELNEAPQRLYRDMISFAKNDQADQLIDSIQKMKTCVQHQSTMQSKDLSSISREQGHVYRNMRRNFDTCQIIDIYLHVIYASHLLQNQSKFEESSKLLQFSGHLGRGCYKEHYRKFLKEKFL